MPASSVEDKFVWEDRAKSETTFLFEKITISDVSWYLDHRLGKALNLICESRSDLLLTVSAA